MNECEDNKKYAIRSFEFTTIYANKKAISLIGKGSDFSEEMKQTLNQLKPGDKVFIDLIKAKSSDGIIIDISGLTLKITGWTSGN